MRNDKPSETATIETQSPIVEIVFPELDADEMLGQLAFNENCASCHGTNGVGNDGYGPPLIHIIYEPSHHGDASFLLAFARGVPAHHWGFGDMPSQPQIDEETAEDIIRFVRKVQRANGIN